MARSIAADHDAKRARMLKAAARVLARGGFDRAPMSAIATACGVSKANLYHYWPSKEALIFDILNRYLTSLRDRMTQVSVDPTHPETALRQVLAEVLLAYHGMDNEHRIQGMALASLPPVQQSALKQIQRDMVDHMAGLIAALSPDLGNDRPALREVTMSVFGMLNWFYMWNPRADAAARRTYADRVADLTMNGVLPRSDRAGARATGT